jgi:D-3-phosphoglycerate dehydrogenase
MKKILIALQTFGAYCSEPLNLLKKSGMDIVFNTKGHRLVQSEIIDLGRECDGIIAGVEPYDKVVLDKLTRLKCISRCGVGIDSIDTEETKRRQIAVLNTPECVIQPVAELTIAMIFDILRSLTAQNTLLKAGSWEKLPGHLLATRKIGIIGLGKIGKKVAQMMRALNADVYATDAFPDFAWGKKYGVHIISQDELLGLADILTIHVSACKEKPFFLNKELLDRINPGCALINTSRGAYIDETALFDALKTGKLSAAGLDVFSNEPYHGPLCQLNNVILTPHSATLTEESRSQMETEAVKNLLHYFS